ncbi:SDR family oxidoreductase [Nocardia jinanensis]|uniref:Oxidoreductase n=1 Tax=Nocardia jinanensis TaxID=382504 RepID=A0A917VUB1_9NOCA|nr:SDR family oxidoreductase [Nocardia jinanensis]GGL14831.1 oxidoreductase [Nocardia jinanensis]
MRDRKVLVVGASRGIGRTIAQHLARSGAHVALAGRSTELLAETVREHPDRTVAIGCDVGDADECATAVGRAAEDLGGLDALVYAVGAFRFGEMADTSAADWHAVFDTNVIGAALVTQAALPHLKAAGGNAIYLSSDSALHQPPWVGIGPYICSKVALERMVQCWQYENPDIAFSTLAIGPTASSVRERQPEGARFGAIWQEKGQMNGRQLDPSEHAAMVAHILASPARIGTVTIVPR